MVQLLSHSTRERVLVSVDWVAEHLNDASIRIVEVDVDTTTYDQGHLPGAVGWAWDTQLCDTVRRDILSQGMMDVLLGDSGIDNNTTVILYGDNSNWFAAWAFWQLKIYHHKDVRLMDGGRKKWVAEHRQLTTNVPPIRSATYQAPKPNFTSRAFLSDARKASAHQSAHLVDVRSPSEFSGEIYAPPDLRETCQRAGHIPGAINIPWSKACNEDGTLKSKDELRTLYGNAGINGSKPVIAYCRIGERSSHTWFVLKHLLGFKDVRNYDGSWTEWGNLVGASVEKP